MPTSLPDVVCLGFDVGSVACKCVLTDTQGGIVERSYTRTHGRPVETAISALEAMLARRGSARLQAVAGTGSAARVICDVLNVPFVNEVICQALAMRRLRPEVRTLIEMGGQDSKLIFLPGTPDDPRPMVDFAMNTNCAAGTGSFLDQQASRLGVRIEEEFGALALRSKSAPRVAGRCSVFAKSDMIHLQQQAAPVHDIVAGLCLGLARNLKSNLAGGRALPGPIAFTGGVAANRGVVAALEQVLELEPGGLAVPADHACTGAMGAVLATLQERARQKAQGAGGVSEQAGECVLHLDALREYLARPAAVGHRLAQLQCPSRTAVCADCQPEPAAHANGHSLPLNEIRGHGNDATGGNGHGHANGHASGSSTRNGSANGAASSHPAGVPAHPPGVPVDAWLGLDVGSISTKIAVIDRNNAVLAKVYLMTAGQPLKAVRNVLQDIGRQVASLPFPLIIRGVATTGSGRYLTGDIIGADLVINEITAQATAAAALNPEVDTIFEIGGQDSKYIALDRGVVVDFEMNHACAAGTGSFLEEQAERLGVSIKGQFADFAFRSTNPIRLGERCTVFMESDLLSHLQQGAPTPDLVAGLCYSIVSNYINRVVGHRHIGQHIFFQGGTAFNEGVVAAFQAVTGRTITVPPHHEVTGAIGAAVLARQHMAEHPGPSRFGGFTAADTDSSIRSFECDACSNRCEINEVTVAGRAPLSYGSRCDRYNLKKDRVRSTPIPNLFVERQRLLMKHAHLPATATAPAGRKTVGLPLALSNYQLLPFWGTLLGELGLHVVVSPQSNHEIIHRGVEAVLATPCFPVKVAHGHALALVEKKVDYLWLPSIVTLAADYSESKYHQVCPYVSGIPYQIVAALEAQGHKAQVLAPRVYFDKGPARVLRDLTPVCKQLGIPTRGLLSALSKAYAAQEAFDEACRARGREILTKLDPEVRPVIIISRPYNGCDTAVSLDLPNKLRRLNVLPIPLDFLDLRDSGPTNDRVFQGMYWKYGQRILHAARIIRQDPRLHAIYLSNFSCGPDSFLISFFRRMMAPKPSLILEIDEHSADAGVVTRLEAFLESLSHATPSALSVALPIYPDGAVPDLRPRTIYLPWMSDLSYFIGAAFRGAGVKAEVLGVADEASLELGRRHCTGKECLPCMITAGDMLTITRRPGFDKDKAAFFMPSTCGPCRFGQYNSLHKIILSELGLSDIPILSPADGSSFYHQWQDLLGDTARPGWVAVCAANVLTQSRLVLRPYELTPGSIDAVYRRALEETCRLLETAPSDRAVVDHLTRMAGLFAAVPVDRSHRKPRIVIVGEIYVRFHDTANDNLVRQLESLGAEASVATFPEYFFYTNWARMVMARRDRDVRLWLSNFLTDHAQRRIHHRINRAFRDVLGNIDEPASAAFVQLAHPFFDPTFEASEAVLSIAKTREAHHTHHHGVVNVMPFGCMPSTLAGGMLKTMAPHIDDMPTMSVSLDGQQDAMLHTRLEAFIHQARAYQHTMARRHGKAERATVSV